MNFIFFSPHFPQNNTEFCFYLKQAGVNVLGIGDEKYEMLNDRLKQSLNEYYKIRDMEDYDEVLRAVAFLTYKHGKIDRFESLNEYWLSLEARIRADFNIYGIKTDFIENINHKSKMKNFFERAEVNYIQYLQSGKEEEVRKFIGEIGFPIVVKPDYGSGAYDTHKINNWEEVEAFFKNKLPDVEYIVEQFIDGIILTYDGIVDKEGNILFENTFRVEQSIMDIVNNKDHVYYYGIPYVNEKVAEAGRKIIHAFDLKERFFHLEFFEKKGTKEIIALEVNMRAPGALMTDTMNYTHDINIYKAWADMVAGKGKKVIPNGSHFAGYASRKDYKSYEHTKEEILEKFKGKILYHHSIEKIFRNAMGDYVFLFRGDTFEEVVTIKNFIHQEKQTL